VQQKLVQGGAGERQQEQRMEKVGPSVGMFPEKEKKGDHPVQYNDCERRQVGDCSSDTG
jgi:hypothetical protein